MTRHRSTVLVSLPACCQACNGTGVLQLVQLLGFHAVGRIRCPHCRPEPGRDAVPIPLLPYRTDIPKGGVA